MGNDLADDRRISQYGRAERGELCANIRDGRIEKASGIAMRRKE